MTNFNSASIAPFTSIALVTPGSTDLGARGFYVGGTSGTIDFIDSQGNSISGFPVAANTYHPILVRRITAATATPIYVGY